jgi:hypothetical protein
VITWTHGASLAVASNLASEVNVASGKGEVIRRLQYAHSSPGIEDQEIVIAADNGLRTSCERKL